MSDLCLYEFEDIVWDDFCQSDDHIVPHPGGERAADHPGLGDSHKKPRLEVISISNRTGDNGHSAAYGNEGREQGGFSSLNEKRNMLEKDSCAHAPNDVLPSSSGSGRTKDASSLASENTTSSSHASKSNNIDSNGDEICVNGASRGDRIDAVDNNSFADTLGDITHTDTNLDFFENAEDKDSSDMLYYGWPEIGNFEDVDTMFRTCDSTFGFAGIKDDELGWFPSADDIQEPGDVVKPEFKFPYVDSNPVENTSQNHDSSNCSSADGFAMMSAPTRFKDRSWISEKSDSHISFVNGPAMVNGKEGFIPRQQMVEHKKKVKLQNQSIGKRKEQHFRNSSFSYMTNVPNGVVQPPPCYMNSDTSPSSGLTSLNPVSGVKSETNDLTSPSPRDSHASSQLQSSSHDPAFSQAAPEGSGKREKLHNRQGSRYSGYSSQKKASSTVQAAIGDPGSIGEQVHYPRDNSDNHSNIGECSPVIPAELDLGDGQEKSMSSGIDTSLEAASFRQLQLVMEQLDTRTKICIRDSLYRLARSAEQRHNHANLNGSCGDEREASGGAYIGEGSHNFMDIETDTNPIDRSIAHLLFHRPSELSTMPAHGSLPRKSANPVRGIVTGPSVMVEDLVVCDETASAMKKASDTDCRC